MISVALVPLALLVLVLLFGTVRLLQAPGRARVRVGLVASDAINAATVPERFADAKAVAVASAYAFWGGQMGERGAEIVVLPEKLAQVSAASAPGVYRAFAESAARTHVVMVAGFDQPRRNVAVVWGSDGSVRLRYAKRHLVPGFEAAFERGQEDGLLRLPGAMVAVAICKDLDFVEVGRAASRGGAQLMLVPAWDFVRDGRAHARMAVARGIEGGFAVARSARNGVLTVSDSTGRIVAERPSSPGRAATLVADVPLGQAGTLYARWGDWFAWLMVAVTLALGLWPSNRP